MRELPGTEDIFGKLSVFIRALTQDDPTDLYERHKALHAIGKAAIPAIREAILKGDWARVRYPNQIRYITGLVLLVHDLDERESDDVRREIAKRGCDPALARILDSIGSFKRSDYVEYNVCGATIFEHRRIRTKQDVKRRLERWLNVVPIPDLAKIERIYVLRKEDLNALGAYAPVLCCINLVWDNPSFRWSPMSWINNLEIEHSLYHEIGHHVHRHTFGHDPRQEDAASAYAATIIAERSGHVVFRACGLPSPECVRFGDGEERERVCRSWRYVVPT